MSKSKKGNPIPKKELDTNTIKNISTESTFPKWLMWIPFLLGILLYANTLNHAFTQDDAIVMYDNMYTQKGISGIPGLLSKDTFFGFFKEEGKDKLVTGGRYRPFTPVMFAIEHELFGTKGEKANTDIYKGFNPFIGHFINALLYGLLGLCIFYLLKLIFEYRQDFKTSFIYIIAAMALIYIAHPIHTEAVANIKGRDEIMSMLGAIAATIFTIKAIKISGLKYPLLAFLSFFIALMSKENSITFIAIVPLILIFFFNKSFGDAIKSMFPLLGAALLFIIIRTSILGFDIGSTSTELMNNPFLKIVNNNYVPYSLNEKLGTIIYIMGKYLGLLVFPHPLTHDYFPYQIDRMTLASPVVLGILAFIFLSFYAAWYFYKRDRVITFAILYFYITASIVSNLFVNIGTNMNERFMFMPSLAICFLLPYLLYKYLGKNVSLIISVLIVVAFSFKTIVRNRVWKDDFTLFTTDVKTSNKSAKMLNAAGGALTTEAGKTTDPTKKKEYAEQAVQYLKKAVAIHPKYKNAYLLLGNDYFYLGDLDNAILNYENSLKLDPGFRDAKNNIAVAYRDKGRYEGEKLNHLANAEMYLLKSYSNNPTDAETIRLLGITYGIMGNSAKAIEFFNKGIQLFPKDAGNYLNLSITYDKIGDKVNAEKYKQMALQIDPKIMIPKQ